MDVFKDMLHELDIGRSNPDGADQGFLVSYFPDLLDKPMFHPPANGTKVNGSYRLPLGYQMDASYFCKFNKFLLPFLNPSTLHLYIPYSCLYELETSLEWFLFLKQKLM